MKCFSAFVNIIDGKKIADAIREGIRQDVKKLGITPGLAVLLVGNDPASHLYVSLKEKAARDVGIHFEKLLFFATTPEEEIARAIDLLNQRPEIHGIIVQVPLPNPLSEDRLIAAIDPKKDIDGFHKKNIDALLAGTPKVTPSVIRGILALIDAAGVSVNQRNATILANSDIFARPLRKLLLDRGMNVTVTRPDASDALEKTIRADIIITAIGKPHFLTAQMVKKDAIIIDVGTTQIDGKILGDVHPNVAEKAAWLTPVPGGVGPMTVAYLLKNVVEAATASQKH